MKYEQARDLIESGDCVGVKTHSWGGKIIRFGQLLAGLQWRKFGHVGIAVWSEVAGEQRLLVAEMNQAGNTYRPLSQYVIDGCDVGIFKPPHGTDTERLGPSIREALDRHVPYGWLDLIPIGVQLILRRFVGPNNVGGDSGHDKVCSFFAKLVYQLTGGLLPIKPFRPAPAELLDELEFKFEVEM